MTRRSRRTKTSDPKLFLLIVLGVLAIIFLSRVNIGTFLAPLMAIAIGVGIVFVVARVLQRIKRAHKRENEYMAHIWLENLTQLPPAKFEHIVGWVFERNGYTVRVVGKSGDHGLDILLQKDGHSAAAQVKRYQKHHRVTEKEVRDFYGSFVDSDAIKGFFVTTSGFTPAAQVWAHTTRKPLQLIGGEELLEKIQAIDESTWKELLFSKVLEK